MTGDVYKEGEIPLLRLIPLTNMIVDIHEMAKEYDLTKSQLIFMTALYYRGRLHMKKIAEYLSSSKEQATRAVAPLVDKGLVKRLEDGENRTHVFVTLTETGTVMMHRLLESVRSEIGPKLRRSLTEEEMAQLTESVHNVVTLLRKIE